VWNCYVLVIGVKKPCNVEFSGKSIIVDPGIYLYIGSARGPGGTLARVARYLSRQGKLWWHIDRLLACSSSSILGIFLLRARNCDCEEEVSRVFKSNLNGIQGFGSSDKRRDYSHLYKCNTSLINCAIYTYSLLEAMECLEDITYVTLDKSYLSLK